MPLGRKPRRQESALYLQLLVDSDIHLPVFRSADLHSGQLSQHRDYGEITGGQNALWPVLANDPLEFHAVFSPYYESTFEGDSMRWSFRVALLLLPCLGHVSAQDRNADTRSSGVTTEKLLRTNAAWDDTPYIAYPKGAPEITVLKITVPAHGELPWHTHSMPNAAYVLSGEITVEEQNGTKRHFSAGQVIPETVNTRHRGVVGDTPAVFIVFYPGVKGMPLSQRAP
jgi:quercetin dioxygenase-like cupin family protein